MLGIRPEFDGLVIDPCIPGGWDGFTAVRRFRGAVYEIEMCIRDRGHSGAPYSAATFCPASRRACCTCGGDSTATSAPKLSKKPYIHGRCV